MKVPLGIPNRVWFDNPWLPSFVDGSDAVADDLKSSPAAIRSVSGRAKARQAHVVISIGNQRNRDALRRKGVVFIVTTSGNKTVMVSRVIKRILIDDEPRVREPWSKFRYKVHALWIQSEQNAISTYMKQRFAGINIVDGALVSAVSTTRRQSPKWLENLRAYKSSQLPSTVLMDIFSGLREVYNSAGPLEVDDLLVHISLDELSNEALVALMRYSFPMRFTLPSWRNILDKISSELSKRGADPGYALRGLNAG